MSEKTITTEQSVSNRELSRLVAKRTAPGVLLIASVGGLLLIGPPLLTMAASALAG